jgi:hypothetical protein
VFEKQANNTNSSSSSSSRIVGMYKKENCAIPETTKLSALIHFEWSKCATMQSSSFAASLLEQTIFTTFSHVPSALICTNITNVLLGAGLHPCLDSLLLL